MNVFRLVGVCAVSLAMIGPVAAEDESSWIPPGLDRAVEATGGLDGGRHGGNVVESIRGFFEEGLRGRDFGTAVAETAQGRSGEASQGRGGMGGNMGGGSSGEGAGSGGGGGGQGGGQGGGGSGGGGGQGGGGQGGGGQGGGGQGGR